LRSIAIIAVALATLTVGPTAAAATPEPGRAGVSVTTKAQLTPLAQLAAERVLVADKVAAAKWHSGQPIDDPAREQQVLDAAAAEAQQIGTDPAEVVRVFKDQIEASKVVQRGLFALWQADPALAPTSSPDLSQIRAELDRIDRALVPAIADTQHVRSSPSCDARLAVAYGRTVEALRLDALHSLALARALPHVCENTRA
jgi:chorismate mutase